MVSFLSIIILQLLKRNTWIYTHRHTHIHRESSNSPFFEPQWKTWARWYIMVFTTIRLLASVTNNRTTCLFVLWSLPMAITYTTDSYLRNCACLFAPLHGCDPHSIRGINVYVTPSSVWHRHWNQWAQIIANLFDE